MRTIEERPRLSLPVRTIEERPRLSLPVRTIEERHGSAGARRALGGVGGHLVAPHLD